MFTKTESMQTKI